MIHHRVFRYLSRKSKAKVFIVEFSGFDSKLRAKKHARRLQSLFPDIKFTVEKAKF